jgi:hypothetical protein
MLGLITYIGFHKNGANDDTAGLALTKEVKARTQHTSRFVQSSEKRSEETALKLGTGNYK